MWQVVAIPADKAGSLVFQKGIVASAIQHGRRKTRHWLCLDDGHNFSWCFPLDLAGHWIALTEILHHEGCHSRRKNHRRLPTSTTWTSKF